MTNKKALLEFHIDIRKLESPRDLIYRRSEILSLDSFLSGVHRSFHLILSFDVDSHIRQSLDFARVRGRVSTMPNPKNKVLDIA